MTTTTVRRFPVVDIVWMREGACLDHGDLPWIADPEQIAAWDRLVMGALCQDCPVLSDCAGFATAEKVTAGFWAGRDRDPASDIRVAGPGWATEPLPGLAGLGGVA